MRDCYYQLLYFNCSVSETIWRASSICDISVLAPVSVCVCVCVCVCVWLWACCSCVNSRRGSWTSDPSLRWGPWGFSRITEPILSNGPANSHTHNTDYKYIFTIHTAMYRSCIEMHNSWNKTNSHNTVLQNAYLWGFWTIKSDYNIIDLTFKIAITIQKIIYSTETNK